MKLGPIQAGPNRFRGRALRAGRAERRRWCRHLRERLGDERAQPGVGGAGAMERGEVQPGWGKEGDEATHEGARGEREGRALLRRVLVAAVVETTEP